MGGCDCKNTAMAVGNGQIQKDPRCRDASGLDSRRLDAAVYSVIMTALGADPPLAREGKCPISSPERS